MAWTQADIDALDAAIAGWGAIKSFSFGDQTFERDELDQVLKLRAVIQAALNAAAGTSKAYRLAATSKGV